MPSVIFREVVVQLDDRRARRRRTRTAVGAAVPVVRWITGGWPSPQLIAFAGGTAAFVAAHKAWRAGRLTGPRRALGTVARSTPRVRRARPALPRPR
jgi:hypothetical protein